jgi:hypothetical protein
VKATIASVPLVAKKAKGPMMATAISTSFIVDQSAYSIFDTFELIIMLSSHSSRVLIMFEYAMQGFVLKYVFF